jgi:hypothetical protein
MDPVTLVSIVQMLRRARGRKGFKDMFGLKNVFALVGLGVVGFVVAGWYLGWYGVSTTVDGTGKSNVGVNINSGQVVKDLKTAEHKVEEFVEQRQSNVAHVTSNVDYAPPEVPPLPSLPPSQNYSSPQMPQSYSAPPMPQNFSTPPMPQNSNGPQMPNYGMPQLPQNYGTPQFPPK